MPLYGRRASKPEPGALIDWSQPLAKGLMGFYAMNEGAGQTLYDATGNLALATAGFGAANPWGSGPAGGGLLCNGAGKGAAAILPAGLRFAWPLSIAVGLRILGTPDSNANFFALTYDNANVSPWEVIQLAYDGSSLALEYNGAGAWIKATMPGYATGVDMVQSATIYGPSGYAAWVKGAQAASSSSSISNPTYASTAQLAIGNYTGISRNSNAIFYWGAWWNRVLSPAEHAAIGASPNAIFGQAYGSPRSYFLMRHATATTTLVRRTLSDRAGSRGVA